LKGPSNKSTREATQRELRAQDEDKDTCTPQRKSKKTRNKDKKQTREAQTVLQLITGLDTIYLPFTSFSTPSQTASPAGSNALPDVSSKEIKKLKGKECFILFIRDVSDITMIYTASLSDPKEAPEIVKELKKIPVDGGSPAKNDGVHTNFKTRAVCLECTDSEALSPKTDHDKSPFADKPNGSPTTSKTPVSPTGHTKQMSGAELFTGKFQALSAVAGDGVPTPGKILGQVATSTGTFSALAGVTGRLIEASGSHEGLISPPCDRMSILVYWWGYELVLPPPSLKYLGNARSVAG
jgi:hypothetical protein